MLKRAIPAVDAALTPRHGFTRLGQALNYDRAPSADLAPWVARLYVTAVEAPADHCVDCGLFNDVAMVRIQLRGDWSGATREGPRQFGKSALHFGPHSRRMPISVTGSFVSFGMGMRPGAGTTVTGKPAHDFVDCLIPLEDAGILAPRALLDLDPGADPEYWLTSLEDVAREIIFGSGAKRPEDVTTRFEALAYRDPNASVEDFARECGIGLRQLERIVLRDFGLSPKQVLRRARALDMAAHLRGVADEAEGEELILRYYDQSHLIRDFTAFFGMSPRQFVTRAQPIMTLSLENRQARRLEAIQRLEPGAVRPWQ